MKLKTLAKRILPARLSAEISAYRWWRHLIAQNARDGNVELTRRLIEQCGNAVVYGPFMGLRYPADILLSHCSTHNLLGTYEVEIHPWLERLLANRYECAVVIGCGEGYYAVGIALRTAMSVRAYDTCITVRRDCRRMAKVNRVSSRVHGSSWCGSRHLAKLQGMRCLVLSDCEGYEQNLFTPQTVPSLLHSDLLIELHDHGMPSGSMRGLLQARLQATHRVEVVSSRPRQVSDFPHLAGLDPADAQRGIDEGARGTVQQWMLATALRP